MQFQQCGTAGIERCKCLRILIPRPGIDYDTSWIKGGWEVLMDVVHLAKSSCMIMSIWVPLSYV